MSIVSKEEPVLINGKQSHSLGPCVCMVCSRFSSPKFYDFYKYMGWEVCKDCVEEVKKIEERKQKRKANKYVTDIEEDHKAPN